MFQMTSAGKSIGDDLAYRLWLVNRGQEPYWLDSFGTPPGQGWGADYIPQYPRAMRPTISVNEQGARVKTLSPGQRRLLLRMAQARTRRQDEARAWLEQMRYESLMRDYKNYSPFPMYNGPIPYPGAK